VSSLFEQACDLIEVGRSSSQRRKEDHGVPRALDEDLDGDVAVPDDQLPHGFLLASTYWIHVSPSFILYALSTFVRLVNISLLWKLV
jgi:hypothetical protein